jgi:hypothetical protein
MIRKASGVATVLRREAEDWPILEIAWSRGSRLRLKLAPRTWLPCVSDLPNSTNSLAKLILPELADYRHLGVQNQAKRSWLRKYVILGRDVARARWFRLR